MLLARCVERCVCDVLDSASILLSNHISWTGFLNFSFFFSPTMKLSIALLSAVALGAAYAAPATVPREPSGRLAIKVNTHVLSKSLELLLTSP